MDRPFLFLAVLALLSCTSRKGFPCTNTPEDVLSPQQAKALYFLTDSLYHGSYLRHCQLIVTKAASNDDTLRYTVTPNVTHIRTYVYHFKVLGGTVQLVP
jgi:hypothetical protein